MMAKHTKTLPDNLPFVILLNKTYLDFIWNKGK